MKFKFILLFLFIILFDFILNILPTIKEQKNYRKIHCFYKNDLFLCPDKTYTFTRKDNQKWTVSTNAYGERISKSTDKNQEYEKEIWFMGDSISFGYLVNNEDTAPYLLNQILNIPTRNLGVDSIGTIGIVNRLNKALEDHPNTQIQTLIWIYNTSDFTDDLKELHRNNIKKHIFYLHYNLAKISNIYNGLLLLKKTSQQESIIPETTIVDPTILNFEHITYKNIKNLYHFINTEKRIKNFLILVYPGMNIATKKPDIDSPITLSLLKFFQEQKIPHRDVFQEFLKANQPYFTFDGHPSEEGYKIFTEVLIDQIVPTLQK